MARGPRGLDIGLVIFIFRGDMSPLCTKDLSPYWEIIREAERIFAVAHSIYVQR